MKRYLFTGAALLLLGLSSACSDDAVQQQNQELTTTNQNLARQLTDLQARLDAANSETTACRDELGTCQSDLAVCENNLHQLSNPTETNPGSAEPEEGGEGGTEEEE